MPITASSSSALECNVAYILVWLSDTSIGYATRRKYARLTATRSTRANQRERGKRLAPRLRLEVVIGGSQSMHLVSTQLDDAPVESRHRSFGTTTPPESFSLNNEFTKPTNQPTPTNGLIDLPSSSVRMKSNATGLTLGASFKSSLSNQPVTHSIKTKS